MKFSYTLIKKLYANALTNRPRRISKAQIIEALTMHSFEAKDAAGDTFEVDIPPNRYSDAASHIGIAREVAAILGMNQELRIKNYGNKKPLIHNSKFIIPHFKVSVKDTRSCPRYTAQYFDNVKVKPSPKWMQKVLKDCGLRPINNVVDIMNYVMLEVGQPMHAFDYDKLSNPSRIKSNESRIFEENSR